MGQNHLWRPSSLGHQPSAELWALLGSFDYLEMGDGTMEQGWGLRDC